MARIGFQLLMPRTRDRARHCQGLSFFACSDRFFEPRPFLRSYGCVRTTDCARHPSGWRIGPALARADDGLRPVLTRNDGGDVLRNTVIHILTRSPQERRGWPGQEPGHDKPIGHLTWKPLQRPKPTPSPASTDPPPPLLLPPSPPAPGRNHNGSRRAPGMARPCPAWPR
jgi:hypothetical protein